MRTAGADGRTEVTADTRAPSEDVLVGLGLEHQM